MPNDEKAILEQLNRDYVRSVQDSDVARFEEILAPGFMNSNPDGALILKLPRSPRRYWLYGNKSFTFPDSARSPPTHCRARSPRY